MSKLILSIEGMSCNHCTSSVTSALTALNGIENVAVSLEEKSATVVYDAAKITPETMTDVIDDLGFAVTSIQAI